VSRAADAADRLVDDPVARGARIAPAPPTSPRLTAPAPPQSAGGALRAREDSKRARII
jgi:hypothetical protein